MIEVKDVVKVYQMGEVKVHALDGISLRVEQGEMVAIMGPSGSGKSTLMNIIGCLDKPTSGSYRLEGQEVSQLSDDQLARVRNRKLGFVFQTFNLLPRTTALANVELPLIYGGGRDRHQRAARALARVGMAVRGHHKPNELSGGEQQRVAIARALMQTPPVILADEPTGNLDSHTSEQIISLFEELNRQDGITVILVTHEREIADHTRRIVYLRDGRVDREEVVR